METEMTSVNISYTTPLGKKSSRAFTNIDPNASDSSIADFSEAMNDLTNNTLTATSKITKKEIDTSVTYYDLTLNLSKGEDDNAAIAISGSTITVDLSEISGSGTDPDSGMTYADIGAKINDTRIPIPSFILTEISGTQGDNTLYNIYKLANLITIGFKQSDNTINFSFTITIPAGVYNNQHYNAATVTINFV